MELHPDPEPFTDADGYAVADEILEYFEHYQIATLAPIASIIRREREKAIRDNEQDAFLRGYAEARADWPKDAAQVSAKLYAEGMAVARKARA